MILKISSLFLTLGLSVQLAAQVIELPRLVSWNAKTCTFNDGSYILELIGKQDEINYTRKLISFSAEGEKLDEKTLSSENHWDFSPGVINVDKTGSLRSVIDRKHKVSYTLYVSKTTVKVTRTTFDFETKETIVDGSALSKQFVGANSGTNINLSRGFIGYLGEDGNPGWVMRCGVKEVVFVSYDVESQQVEMKAIELSGEEFALIGRQDGKSWIAEWVDFGKKKPNYTIKLISIDEHGKMKDEGIHTLNKPAEIMVSKFTRIMDMDGENAMVLGVVHFDGKVYDGESDMVKHIDFLKVEEGTIVQSFWDASSAMYYNGIPAFTHHETTLGHHRFAMNAGNSGICMDTDFEDKNVSNLNVLELKRVGWADIDTWNVLLYRDELSEDQVETINGLIQDETNVQYVFKIGSEKLIVVHGKHFFADKKEVSPTTVEVL